MTKTDDHDAIYQEELKKEMKKFDQIKRAGLLSDYVKDEDADIISDVYEQMVSKVENEYESNLI